LNIDYFTFLDIIGIVAFSISGFLISVRKNLDLLGGFLICSTTALGGGIMRDILANNTPFVFNNLYPLIVILVIYVIGIFSRFFYQVKTKMLYITSDSVGLVFFAITGAMVAIEANFHIIGICMMSLITASGGGALRDIALREIPSLFKEDFYGMVAVIIGLIMFLENRYYEINDTIIIANMLFGLIIRYIVVRRKISMPKL